ncbi:uncharacterized protein [Maniola hyperantus]|uniref:uncharacterized protein isoform X3 n=1 Tax=Aphantopus hyperantus TaxID=2795564 RepID=UPI003748DC80
MKMVPDMKQEIQHYFTDPDDLLKKCCEAFEFQRRHRGRLLSYLLRSTKKFYAAREELKRMTELCQKQHIQIREYQKTIKRMEGQNSTMPRHTSPFNVQISPGNNFSPGYIQSTPTYKRPAKSTPYSQPYQTNLMTPTRLIKPRFGNTSAHSQKSNNSNKISSTVFTPPTPESRGLFPSQHLFSSQSSTQSNDSAWSSWKRSPTTVLQWIHQKNVNKRFKK